MILENIKIGEKILERLELSDPTYEITRAGNIQTERNVVYRTKGGGEGGTGV